MARLQEGANALGRLDAQRLGLLREAHCRLEVAQALGIGSVYALLRSGRWPLGLPLSHWREKCRRGETREVPPRAGPVAS